MQDIPPNRLEAAKAAARWFVEHPVLGTQIGIVAFAGFAELAQEPTTEQSLLQNSINNLTTTTRTAIGSAILRSLDAIAEVDKSVAPSDEMSKLPGFSPSPLPEPRFSEEDYVPHIIVLLTDGASNTGPSPFSAAQQAVARGVRIYPIGFGTANNGLMDCWNLYANDSVPNSGSGSQPGGGFGSGADEETLKQIAKMTGGEFYSATSAAELQMVFQSLHSLVAMTNKTIEISVFFAALGAMLAIVALAFSMLWHPLL
jgi:Ca-activated chloride channel family protein